MTATTHDTTTSDRPRVVIVDDDVELCTMLAEYLAPENLDLEAVHDGAEALTRLLDDAVDLVILDVMLPGMNGLDVLRKLREQRDTPVIMLTARGDDVDRIVGLEIGADDYLPKPFNPRELTARIRAILRRVRAPATPAGETAPVLEVGPLSMDTARMRATLHGEALVLTGAEFRVLETLLQGGGQVVSRDTLTERALGRRLTPYDRAVDTHVSNLRRKLGRNADGESPIRNVRGAGYLLDFGAG